MRDNPINALRETLRCGLAFRKSRLESLCVLVFGVFVARTVNLSHLACHFPGRARSTERIAILENVLRLFGVDKIASLLADREFIGDAWLAAHRSIPRAQWSEPPRDPLLLRRATARAPR